MLRALIELLITIFAVMVARAVLASVLKNIAGAAMGSFQNRPQQAATGTSHSKSNTPPAPEIGGELHKDPICGTYVAESAALRQQLAGRTFFYCSDECRKKHALAAR
ncbi:MAG: hypothetical protein JOY54_11775 [Acidobacteriaceae bacterium]|nr:hypothetical protein [Acidobacteriaceae bacterium]